MKCEGATHPCDATEGVKEEACRTAYHVPDCGHSDCEEHPELKAACRDSRDPNKTAWLCRECATEYHSNWDEMWASYWHDRY